jgi:hypothetical protein
VTSLLLHSQDILVEVSGQLSRTEFVLTQSLLREAKGQSRRALRERYTALPVWVGASSLELACLLADLTYIPAGLMK